jgi:tRNA(Glu) U13 pseudouridine synthase TruD
VAARVQSGVLPSARARRQSSEAAFPRRASRRWQAYLFNVGASAACAAGELPAELPLVGSQVPAPDAGTPAGAAMLAAMDGIDAAALKDAGLRGATRAVVIRAEGFRASSSEAVLETSFELPSGAYATTLLRELFEDVEVAREPVASSS